MSKQSAQTGRESEDLAAAYLAGLGYELLARNFRGAGGELDIVCQKGGVIYFVEVKARKRGAMVRPAEAVTPDKKRRLASCAEYWLYRRGQSGAACSFLLLTLEIAPDRPPKIELVEDFLRW